MTVKRTKIRTPRLTGYTQAQSAILLITDDMYEIAQYAVRAMQEGRTADARERLRQLIDDAQKTITFANKLAKKIP